MNIPQINNKMIVKSVLVIIVIAVLGLVVHKYLQFRTAKLEKLRVELAREEAEKRGEAIQKTSNERIYRCDDAKPILEITYKNNLLSVNLDCVDQIGSVLQEISKKVGVKIVHPKLGFGFYTPISFNNLTLKEGLEILGKKTGYDSGIDIYKPSYRPDKNIWSFDEVILEVKDPPENGVTHIVETKDSFDFVRADGTNKRSYELSMIGSSRDNKFFTILVRNRGFVIFNNQGEEQQVFKKSPGLSDFILSPNGKYMVGSYHDGECGDQCDTNSYILNEQGFTKIDKIGETSKIEFSQDGSFFISRGNTEDHFRIINKDYFISTFDEKGQKLWSKNRISQLGREIDFKILDDNTIQVEVELPNQYDDHIYYRYDQQGNLIQ